VEFKQTAGLKIEKYDFKKLPLMKDKIFTLRDISDYLIDPHIQTISTGISRIFPGIVPHFSRGFPAT
jgi:hypothetical protein